MIYFSQLILIKVQKITAMTDFCWQVIPNLRLIIGNAGTRKHMAESQEDEKKEWSEVPVD